MAAYSFGDLIKVKVCYGSTGEVEWMWMRVNSCDNVNRVVLCQPDNIPLLNTELRVGQQLAVSFDKIKACSKAQRKSVQ